MRRGNATLTEDKVGDQRESPKSKPDVIAIKPRDDELALGIDEEDTAQHVGGEQRKVLPLDTLI